MISLLGQTLGHFWSRVGAFRQLPFIWRGTPISVPPWPAGAAAANSAKRGSAQISEDFATPAPRPSLGYWRGAGGALAGR